MFILIGCDDNLRAVYEACLYYNETDASTEGVLARQTKTTDSCVVVKPVKPEVM